MKISINIRPYLVIASLLLLTTLTGCHKDKDNLDDIEIPDFSHIRPQPTAKGTAEGSTVTEVIGEAGGEIVSADGSLKVSIPAGALSANATIGIQSLTNTAPLGLGQNYRLTPEGIVFAQPVTLTFSYDEELLGSVVPEFLWVVTQNADGTWAGGRKSVVNKNNKTVSVATTHFSDWGIGRFMDIALKPTATSVKKGENVDLGLTGFKYDPDDEGDDFPPLGQINDDLVGLNDAQQLLLSTEQFATFKVKNWTLNGASSPVNNNNGKLEVTGKTATYTAPGAVPNPSTVTVSINLEARDNIGQLHGYSLLSNITVVDSEYYAITTIGGQEVDYYDGMEYTYSGEPKPKDRGSAIVSLQGNELDLLFSTPGLPFSTLGIRLKDPKKGTNGTCINPSSYQVTYNDGPAGFMEYFNSYRDQKWNSVTSMCEGLTKCSEVNVTLSEYTGEKGSAVAGKFSGILFHVGLPVPGCPPPIPLSVAGEFRLIVPK